MKKIKWLLLVSQMLILSACQSGTASRVSYPLWDEQTQWQLFKECFIRDEGRVIDTWQANSSHSESQGYGMLLATAVQDRETFEKLWQWTQQNLQVRDDALMVWRWQEKAPYTPDMNNASDGDLLIAWALIRAAEVWRYHRQLYLSEADEILTDLANSVVRLADSQYLLPASYGFESDQHFVVNLSYYVYPALYDAARLQVQGPWSDLIKDGLTLQKQSIQQDGLPKDWDLVDRATGLLVNKKEQPSEDTGLTFQRFGYEAIRIPLYSCWINDCGSTFDPLKHYWANAEVPPAWVDYGGKHQAEYPLASGGMAVRDLLLSKKVSQQNKLGECSEKTDYYNAVLSLLSQVAAQEAKVYEL